MGQFRSKAIHNGSKSVFDGVGGGGGRVGLELGHTAVK